MSTRPLPAPETGPLVRVAHLSAALPVLLAASAVVVWGSSLDEIDPEKMNDLGLVSVLPTSVLVAFALLTAGFVLALLERPVREPLLAFQIVVLILMLYGITGAVEEVPRLAAAWRHAGVIEYITRTGSIDPQIDAYFNWPGFFILGAFLTEVAGLESAVGLLRWSPVFFGFAFLGPLVMIFRTVTADTRLVWLAAWIFYATNWIGQDYFSPQAFSYFLYLMLLAVLLRWFRASSEEVAGPELRPGRRAALMGIALVLVAAMVPSHQLTPFATLLGVGALVALGRCSARGLPVLTAVLIGAWMSFLAIAYVKGHLDVLTGSVGKIGDTLEANVGGRLQGSAEHIFIVQVRLLLTGVVWVLALLGGVRAFRQRRLDVAFVLLALSPFPLLALQPYGGEVLLRVYLFALPFMAFFVASLFNTAPSPGRNIRTFAAVSIVLASLLGGTLFARYGNERMEHFTQEEVAAVDHLYEVASPNSVFVSWGRNLPWKSKDYEKYAYRVVTAEEEWRPLESTAETVRRIERLMAEGGDDAFLILTRSQTAEGELLGLSAPGALDRVEASLAGSPEFEPIYSNRDARIYVLSRETSR